MDETINGTNDRTKMGLEILQAALLLGILGDAMLRAIPWGLNVFLAIAGVIGATVMLTNRWRRTAFKRRDIWLYGCMVVFSLSIAWRDSEMLTGLNILALLTLFALVTLRATGLKIQHASMIRYGLSYFTLAANACFGPFVLFFSDVKWSKLPSTGWTKQLSAILRGLMIAVPLLVIFGLLLTAADAVFAGLIDRTFHINIPSLVGHIALGSMLAWLGAGFLRGVILGANGEFATAPNATPAPNTAASSGPLSLDLSKASVTIDHDSTPPESSADEKASASATGSAGPPPSAPPARMFSLGPIEVGIVLGLLNVLFLCFVIVQIRYLFGGAALVQSTIGMSYAEYARHGFFELVTVALLVLPILLSLHWLLDPAKPQLEKLFRVMAGTQILLLFVIMASAVKRMMLYQGEYGLTELRVYTTVFMGWLAVVFIWFSLTVLRGARRRFVSGAVIAGFVFIFGLHVLNPDGLIVRVNTARAVAGKPIDIGYLATLSADAQPDLLDALPALRHSDRCSAAGRLLFREKHTERGDWRSWNWSRSRAEHRLAAETARLRALGCPDNFENDTSRDVPSNPED